MVTTTFNFADNSGFVYTDTEVDSGVAKQSSPFQLEANLIMAQPVKVRLFSSFSAVVTLATLSHEITFIVEDNGTLKYWSGAAWVASDGSAAQSNSAAEMNANLPSLITNLSTHDIRFMAVFQSPDTLQTSELDSFSFEYVDGFNVCNVFVSLIDLMNVAPTIDVDNPPKLRVSNDRGFLQGCNVVYPFSQSVDFDANGEANLEVMETESTGEKLEFSITFPDGYAINSFRFDPAIVPNQPWANLSDIIMGVSEDFQVRSGTIELPNATKTRVVPFLSDIFGTDYGVKTNLGNLIDAAPIYSPVIAISKPSTGITAKWSSNTDSVNYILDYLAVRGSVTIIQGGTLQLDSGVQVANVVFADDIGTTDYAPIGMLTNLVDGSVTLVPIIVTSKTSSGFTAIWSSALPTANYRFDYIVRKNCSSKIKGGRRWQSGSEPISNGVKQSVIVFDEDLGTTQYALLANMSNQVDASPSIHIVQPVAKSSTGCTVKWSANTDSANYVMEYIAVEVLGG